MWWCFGSFTAHGDALSDSLMEENNRLHNQICVWNVYFSQVQEIPVEFKLIGRSGCQGTSTCCELLFEWQKIKFCCSTDAVADMCVKFEFENKHITRKLCNNWDILQMFTMSQLVFIMHSMHLCVYFVGVRCDCNCMKYYETCHGMCSNDCWDVILNDVWYR